MSASMNAGKRSGNRRQKHRSYQPMAEINVTPFVDVMLVLLIVFMVTAPLLTVGVQIDLPKTQAKQLESKKEPLTISIDHTGRVFLQSTDSELKLAEIVPKLVAITKNKRDERIFVRGDRKTSYEAVMKVMGLVSAAGFSRLALVTDTESEK